jgi:quercetin dioxygenase-like cupin family protein
MAPADPTSATALSPVRAVIVRAGEGHLRPLRKPGGRSEALVRPEMGARQLVVSRVTIDPGSERRPYHLHRHAENTYLVLEGTLEVQTADGDHTLGPGEAIFAPPGQPHSTHDPGPEPTVVLAIYDRSTEGDFEVVERSSPEEKR